MLLSSEREGTMPPLTSTDGEIMKRTQVVLREAREAAGSAGAEYNPPVRLCYVQRAAPTLVLI